ncbi:MAG: hypothetical protein WCT42_00410 [Candidatus Paceibacterota bacterium]|jgi:hypothetical protein
MDQTQLQQNIAKYYAKLPSDLQQSFSSMAWMEDLKNISTKYSLTNEQTETLATETTLVLLGIVHLEDYVLTLKNDLKLNDETFNKILDDLDANILKDTKDDLVKTFELNIELLEKENSNKEKEIIKTNEDEVPLPPYAEVIKNDELPITKVEIPKGIEVKPEISIAPKNIFEEKMKGATVSTQTVSDYSVTKKDPYREEF